MTNFESTLTAVEKISEKEVEKPSAVDGMVSVMRDILDLADDTIWLHGHTTMFEHIADKVIDLGGYERLKTEFPDHFRGESRDD